jgi:crotonobetainyl-CoA:carnitine CoA-transferase CaiB-like acyl-CoA transferase
VYDVLSGIKVVELSMWAFVPTSGAVLADWGADVIKIVPVDVQDPMRGKGVIADLPEPRMRVPFMWELMNRGKRCIGLDVSNPQGYEVLTRLVARADVFTVNLLPPAQERFRVTAADIRAIKPDIIYARGTGQGTRGPAAERGGFDATSFWAGSGLGHTASQVTDEFLNLLSPAFGDVLSGLALASGIAAALVRRMRTGEGAIVDVSLLATGMFSVAPSIVASDLFGIDTIPRVRHREAPNPLMTAYATKDGRYIVLGGMRTDTGWNATCASLRAPGLADDPRFAAAEDRSQNRPACIEALDQLFASRTLDEWREILVDYPAPWTVVKTAREMHSDEQVLANGYIAPVQTAEGPLPLVPSPVQFDEKPIELRAAPGHGEQTDEILAELGFGEEEIIALKIASAVL